MRFSNSYKRDLLFVSIILNVSFDDFLTLHELLSLYDPNSDKDYDLDLCKLINRHFWLILDKVSNLNDSNYIFGKAGLVVGYRFNGITLTAKQGRILYNLLVYRDNDYFIVD